VKGGKLPFFNKFPAVKVKSNEWFATVKRKNWTSTEYGQIFSEHFVSGIKSKDSLAPNYVSGLFKHVKSSVKWHLEREMDRYQKIHLLQCYLTEQAMQ